MILEQHYLGCLAQASYFLCDPASGKAVVVDPRRDVDLYLERAAHHGVEIALVVLTHFHADFVAGHIELRERTGARIALGPGAQADFDFDELRDGQRLDFGALRLEVRSTPGHTPESVCLVVYDLDESAEEPQGVLTGDTLFIGDVGRPDLMSSVGYTREALAGMLYDSLQRSILTLPDATKVYPGHGAGSACGKALSNETVSTIGEQRALNYALQPMSKADFVREVTTGLRDAPAYFAHDAQRNREERPTLDAMLARSLRPLSLEQALELAREQGAQLLDTRDLEEYASAHLAGAIYVGLCGKYASWAGTLLDPERPIVILAGPGREHESAMRLGRIGFDEVAGYVEDYAGALASHPDLARRTTRVDSEELIARQRAGETLPIVDVRACGEWDAGHLPGATHIALDELPKRLAELPAGPYVLQCAGGYRSLIAASLIEAAGAERLVDLRGGIEAWQRSGGPIERPVNA
ncbi:MAG: MBL fold metallo-hydrolase [Planctomycetes bacterium]|nr:MBL fold metallo-hydrolase [Planctomycetota bacterium]